MNAYSLIEAQREAVIRDGVQRGYEPHVMKLSLSLEDKLRKIQTHTDLADEYRQMNDASEWVRHKRERALLLADVMDTLHRVPDAKVAHGLAKERTAL